MQPVSRSQALALPVVQLNSASEQFGTQMPGLYSAFQRIGRSGGFFVYFLSCSKK